MNWIRGIAASWLLLWLGQGSDVASAPPRETKPLPPVVDINHPFHREELKTSSAEGCRMIEKMWRVGAGASAKGNPP